jgi:hypothetical protein
VPGNPSPAVAHRRARLGGIKVRRPDDEAALADARRDLRAELLAEHVKRVVAEFPPLTPAQLDRIAALLRAGTAS